MVENSHSTSIPRSGDHQLEVGQGLGGERGNVKH